MCAYYLSFALAHANNSVSTELAAMARSSKFTLQNCIIHFSHFALRASE